MLAWRGSGPGAGMGARPRVEDEGLPWHEEVEQGRQASRQYTEPAHTHENGKKKRCQYSMPQGTSNTGTAKQAPSRREPEMGCETDQPRVASS